MIGMQKNKVREDKHWWLTAVILTTQRSGRSPQDPISITPFTK
jgi:hypothetical protein